MSAKAKTELRRNPHYRYGDCSHPGCDRKDTRIVKGLCTPHYDRLRKYGDPSLGMPLKGTALKFLNDVALKHEGDDCLPWPFATSTAGYGQVIVDGKKHCASRYICGQKNGPAPTPRHEAAHTCGNGHLGCVTPGHLVWKTPSENQMDRVEHGTSNRGERQWLAKITTEQAIEIKRLLPEHSTTEIAEMFGVSYGIVSHIRKGTSWAWLDEPQSLEQAA